MQRRFLAVISVVGIMLTLALFPQAVFGEDSSGWSLSISSVSTLEKLHTVQYSTGYDGTIDEIVFDDKPSSGMCYAIVSIRATKQIPTAEALSASEMELVIDGSSFKAVTPISVFLKNHNYETFSAEQVIASSSGFIAFEVPESLIDFDGTGWTVRCGESLSAPFNQFDNEVPFGENYVNSQSNIEKNLLEYYEQQGGASLDAPMVVQDVYGSAPLTALAVFETPSEQEITVTVHGKDDSGDITYPIHGKSAHHEVPIMGLYAGYDNTVTLQAGDFSSDITITTQPLPDSVECVSKVAGSDVQQIGHLFVLQSPHQIVFDNNGDVRWYLPESWSGKSLTSDSSYPMQLSSDASSFYFFRNPLTDTVYDDGVELVHMSWMGKIEHVISNPVLSPDHDLTFIDDNTMLYIQDGMTNDDAAIWQFDLTTGEAQPWLNMNDILDSSVAPSYAGAWNDVWHINSIQYLPEDNSLVLSLRNQSMVIKIDVEARTVDWAFTPASGRNADGSTWARQESVSDVVVLPSSDDSNFEWFYDQHHANVISYDADSGIMDLVLFDNGTYRYNFGDTSNNERYSRVCRYRIDENSKTAELRYQYGKERGQELYSWWYGSAQFMPEMSHYVGSFAVFNGTGSSHIVESNEQGEVVAEYQVERADNGSYRATVFSLAGGLDNANLTSNPGLEIHQWFPGYWQSDLAAEQGDPSLCTVSSIARDGNVLNITGLAQVAEGTLAETAELVADGPGGLFSFGVTVAGSSGKFYARGVDLSSLSDGTYILSVRAQAGTKEVDIPLGYTVAIGDAIDDNIKVTENLPNSKQQDFMETMVVMASSATFSEMIVTQDPFGIAPLTAMAQFHTDDLCSVKVTVHGKNEGTDVSYEIEGERLLHLIPIVGLYYNDTSSVSIALTHQDGSIEVKDLELTTGVAPNPAKMPSMEVEYDVERVSEIAPGLTFCAPSGGSYYYAVDIEGDVRWYYAFGGNVGIDGVSFNDEGHLLLLDGSKASTAETNNFSAMEIDLLGREYRSYYLPNMSFHHELKQLANGNYLALATDYTKSTVNDVIVEFDPGSGEIARRWDMDEVLGRYGISRLATPSYELPVLSDELGDYNENWFHANSALYLEDEDCLIVSSRHQSAVFKIDCSSGEVLWVFSDPEGYIGTGLEDLLLTPVDSEACSVGSFQWQYGQHAAMICSDGELALFDNGNYRTKLAENRVFASDNYSRVLKLDVDEDAKTVSLSWEWGREFASEHYCALIGDIDELGADHYLTTFGGHCLAGPGGEVSDSSALYIESTLFELSGNDVIWSLSSTPTSPVRSSAIYRAERVQITSMPYSYDTLSGSQWVGSAGEVQSEGVDESQYADDLSGVRITSVINEGNRVSISGSVNDFSAVDRLYLYQISGGIAFSKVIELSSDGSFTAAITYPPNRLPQEKSYYLLADYADGSKGRAQLNIEISGMATSAATIFGTETMELGGEQQLELKLSPSGSMDKKARWSSSDSSILEVDNSGKVIAKKPGYAVVSAFSSDNGTHAQKVITVTGAMIETTNYSMRRGDSAALSVINVGDEISLDFIKWFSSDENIATVDEHGVVYGVDKGEAVVWAEIGDRKFECSVTVSVGLEDGVYTISSKLRRNLVLDVSNGSSDNQANVQLWTDNNSLAQQFMVTYIGDGQYQIGALCSDKMLDVAYGGTTDGTNVWQFEQNCTASQKWLIEEGDDGWYTLISAQNGLALDVSGANAFNGSNVQVWESNGTDAQKFAFSERFKEDIYRIGIHADPSLVLDVEVGSPQSGANMQLFTWNRTAAQMFLVTYASEGAYTIAPLCSGNVLDVAFGSQDNGANVQQFEPNDTAAQRWHICRNKDGSYEIISALSGKRLDVSDGVLASESNIQVWEGNGSDAQKFNFYPVFTTKTIASSLDPSLVLDVEGGSTASRANIQLFSRNSTKAQSFYVSDLTASGTRYILPATGGRVSLDAENGGSRNGANAWQYEINGSLAQQWYIQSIGDGQSRIAVSSSGLSLDIPSAEAYSGANVQLYTWNDTGAQKFILE